MTVGIANYASTSGKLNLFGLCIYVNTPHAAVLYIIGFAILLSNGIVTMAVT